MECDPYKTIGSDAKYIAEQVCDCVSSGIAAIQGADNDGEDRIVVAIQALPAAIASAGGGGGGGGGGGSPVRARYDTLPEFGPQWDMPENVERVQLDAIRGGVEVSDDDGENWKPVHSESASGPARPWEGSGSALTGPLSFRTRGRNARAEIIWHEIEP